MDHNIAFIQKIQYVKNERKCCFRLWCLIVNFSAVFYCHYYLMLLEDLTKTKEINEVAFIALAVMFVLSMSLVTLGG